MSDPNPFSELFFPRPADRPPRPHPSEWVPPTPLDVIRHVPADVDGLRSVAACMRALCRGLTPWDARDAILALADAHEIELLVGPWQAKDAALCPPDGHGGRYVTLRVLA